MIPRHYHTGPQISPSVPSSQAGTSVRSTRPSRMRSETCGAALVTLSRDSSGRRRRRTSTHPSGFWPWTGLTLCKTLAGEGWVDVVAVRRPWRNRGLGLALLRHAFTECHRQGTHRVSLSVDAESITGAPRLYGRAGMRVRESYIIHLKEFRPGVDLGMRLDED